MVPFYGVPDTVPPGAYAVRESGYTKPGRVPHIPHPFFWVYEGFRRMPARYMWHGPIEPCQSMSLCSRLTSSCWCGASWTCAQIQSGR